MKYFPVDAGPFRMGARLYRFGTDFGNGEWDARYFQPVDEGTLTEKRRVLAAHPDRIVLPTRPADSATCSAVLGWMRDTIWQELGTKVAPDGSLEQQVREVSACIGEDFVVLGREEASVDARVRLVSVCFPSGWAPETIVGQSFLGLHAPVPEFRAVAQRADSLVNAMIERGPYVRFIWTVTTDAELDHHPSVVRTSWRDAAAGYLRVERQVTVPVAARRASLFLIRTIITPFDELTPEQRSELARSVQGMSDAVLRYKGIERSAAVGLLRG